MCYAAVNKAKVFYGLLKEPELNIALEDDDDDIIVHEDGRPAKVKQFYFKILSLREQDTVE